MIPSVLYCDSHLNRNSTAVLSVCSLWDCTKISCFSTSLFSFSYRCYFHPSENIFPLNKFEQSRVWECCCKRTHTHRDREKEWKITMKEIGLSVCCYNFANVAICCLRKMLNVSNCFCSRCIFFCIHSFCIRFACWICLCLISRGFTTNNFQAL